MIKNNLLTIETTNNTKTLPKEKIINNLILLERRGQNVEYFIRGKIVQKGIQIISFRQNGGDRKSEQMAVLMREINLLKLSIGQV
jgi:hypothetical protein